MLSHKNIKAVINRLPSIARFPIACLAYSGG